MKTTAIIRYFNKDVLTPRELLLYILDLKNSAIKNNEWFYFYFNLLDIKDKNGRYEFKLENGEFDKKKTLSFFNISCDIQSINSDILINKYNEILLKFGNTEEELKYKNFYSLTRKTEKTYKHFSVKYDYYHNSDYTPLFYVLNLTTGTEILNKENILELLKLYFNFGKLADMSAIKTFKTLFFGNVNAKIFNPFIEELALERKILIEKSSNGSIKNITLNKNEIFDETLVVKNLIDDLKLKGILKNITGSHNYVNYDTAELELYDFKPYKSLFLKFKYLENKLSIIISNNSLFETTNLLKEVGMFEDFINNILDKINTIYFPEIEKRFGIVINNKQKLIFNGTSFILDNIEF